MELINTFVVALNGDASKNIHESVDSLIEMLTDINKYDLTHFEIDLRWRHEKSN